MSWVTGLVSWFMGLFGVVTTDTDEVVKIQAAAVRLCGFLPTVETVVALIGAVAPVPGASMGTVVAKRICEAVTKSKAAMKVLGSEPLKPIIDGVVIEGEWVNPKEKK